MTRVMYDAVNVGAGIPDNPQLVAGYIDGNYQSFAGLAARFPNAVHVPIAVWPSTNAGIVLDVETGDAGPGQAPSWVSMRRAAGVDPSVYCSESWWPAVRQAFRDQGVAEPYYWIAAYPGPGPVLYDDPLCVAHQYGGDADLGWDISVVADIWPGIDAGPQPEENDLTPEQAAQLGSLASMYLPGTPNNYAAAITNLATIVPQIKAEVDKLGPASPNLDAVRKAVSDAVLNAPFATSTNRKRLAAIAAAAVQ